MSTVCGMLRGHLEVLDGAEVLAVLVAAFIGDGRHELHQRPLHHAWRDERLPAHRISAERWEAADVLLACVGYV